MTTQKKIDEAANNWNKTDGSNYFKRRTVSINSCHKADDGTYVFVGTSRLHGPVRDTKTKINRLRRQSKHSHDEGR